MKHRLILMLRALLCQAVAFAQHSPDFAEKFMTLCSNDSTVKCITVSPKMMEQLVRLHEDSRSDNIVQAIGKLKSARIVTGSACYYQKAIELIARNKSRFIAGKDYQTEEEQGAFFTRKNKKGDTVEFIMLHADIAGNKFTIVNLTGDIDDEFLCFLFNNKTF